MRVRISPMSPGGSCYKCREEGRDTDTLTPLREKLGRTGGLSGGSVSLESPLDLGSSSLTNGYFGPSNQEKGIRGKLVLRRSLGPNIF